MAKISPLLCVSWGMNANEWTIVKTTTELYIYFVLLKAKNKGISCVKQSQSLAEFSKQHKASEICQAWIVDLITKLQNYII